MNKKFVYLSLLVVLCLILIDAKQTTKTTVSTKTRPTPRKQTQTTTHSTKTRKLGPSEDLLESEIKIKGHENDTISSSKTLKLNVNQPSVDKLEKILEIPGHEKDKKLLPPKKLNISEPSVDAIEKILKIQGHERDKPTAPARLNSSLIEPSVNEAEKQIKISGHENETISSNRIFRMEPFVDGRLPYENRKFKYAQMIEKRQKLKNIEPSNDQLERMIEITNGSLNESPKSNRSDILPSYEGFHGVLMHGDETFQDKLGHNLTSVKPADLDDFKTWMTRQEKENKLDRFKKLHDEFEGMNRKMEDHDEFKTKEDRLSDAENRKRSEKLKRAIREIEKAQADQMRRRKTDL